MQQLEQQISSYIAKNLMFDETAQIPRSDSLLELGVMDSTGAMDLVMYLESEFGITVADEELVPENLDSIERIAAFVKRKTTEKVA